MYRLAILVCAITCLISTGWTDDYKDAKNAAQQGYKEFLKGPLANTQFCADNWLTAQDKVENATLGEPFELYALSPEKIRSYKAGTSVMAIAEKSGIYMFPVLINGNAKLILEVSKYGEDRFQIGSLGDGFLARELGEITTTYTKKNLTPVLLSNYQTHAYFFTVPQLGTDNLTQISTDPTRALNYTTTMNATTVLEKLDAEVQELLKNQQF